MEAPPAAAPDKALAIAINKLVLYGEVPPSGGGARVQATLHFHGAIQCSLHASACIACDWLQPGTRGQTKYLMTNIREHFGGERGGTCCDTASHPTTSVENMTKTGEPLAPCHFRGFRLHTVWTQQAGGDLVHQAAFPRFQGEGSLCMLDYEPKKLPQMLKQGPKMSINLN